MKSYLLAFTLILSGAVYSSLAAQSAPAANRKVRPDASAATEKTDATGKFQKMHASFLERGKAGPMGVLFLGDSITEGWKGASEVWDQSFGKYQPANFGIGGDQTQHVIWRIENGELDGIKPRVVVLMLGTNNTGANTAEEIAAADTKIVSLIRKKLPQSKVLLLAVFPRGPRKSATGTDDGVERMKIIRTVNSKLAKLDDGRTVRFLDLGPKFLDGSGAIPMSIMPDQLHLSPAGYKIWAEAMMPLLQEMMR